eukprot:gene7355-10025_t
MGMGKSKIWAGNKYALTETIADVTHRRGCPKRMNSTRWIFLLALLLLNLASCYRFLSSSSSRYKVLNDLKMRIENSNSAENIMKGEDRNRILFNELKNDKIKFLSILKSKSSIKNSILLHDETNDVNKLLPLHVTKLDAAQLTNLISSLGLLGYKFNIRNEIIFIDHLYSMYSSLSVFDLSRLLVGMARVQIRWDSIMNSKSYDDFINYITNSIMKMDEKGVADILWSLSSMNAQWTNLPSTTKNGLLNSVEKNMEKFSSYTLSSVVFSCAKMGVKWHQFSLRVRKSMLICIQRTLDEFSAQQSSKILWAFGSLLIPNNDYPSNEIIYQLISNLMKEKKSKMGNAISAAQALTGIAKIGISWGQYPKSTREILLEQFLRVIQSPNDRGLVNIVWAMGCMKISPENIRDDILNLLLLRIVQVLPASTGYELSSIICGLAKMDYTWTSLPLFLREALMSNIVRMEETLNASDCAAIIWALGEMDAALDTSPVFFVNAIFGAILRNLGVMKSSDLSRLIWGLNGSNLSWDMIPQLLKWNINIALRRVGQDMTPQEVANCAYGLCILSFDIENPSEAALRGANEVLLSTIRTAGRSLMLIEKSRRSYFMNGNISTIAITELEQLRIFAHYLKVMQFVSDTTRIPEELLNYQDNKLQFEEISNFQKDPKFVFTNNNKYNNLSMVTLSSSLKNENVMQVTSRLQERVIKGLNDAFEQLKSNMPQFRHDEFRIELEKSSFNGVFPVDAAISRNGKIIAFLEVDGPHHYRNNGKSLRRKDKLKELMYKRIHPDASFHRIRWDDEKNIGSYVLGEELATIILSSAKADNMISNSLKSVTKVMGDFFCWGLRNSKLDDL